MPFAITQNLTDWLWLEGALPSFHHLSDWVQRFSLSGNRTCDFTQNLLYFISYSWHRFRLHLMMSVETCFQVCSHLSYIFDSLPHFAIVAVSALRQLCILAYMVYGFYGQNYVDIEHYTHVTVDHLILKSWQFKCFYKAFIFLGMLSTRSCYNSATKAFISTRWAWPRSQTMLQCIGWGQGSM